MFNPVYPLTTEVLQATIDRGCYYFVRNTYTQAFDHFDEGIQGYFIFTHYNDLAKAKAHYNSISHDKHRFLYDWNNPDNQENLKIAAGNPKGYKIFSTYFLPDYKNKITNPLKDKINRYMYRNTDWKPGRGETVIIDFFLEFGTLYITMNYSGDKIKIKFSDIDNLK
ncbi:MAG: hypothetical protein ABUT20_66585 [Bacteroidota bacterium]